MFSLFFDVPRNENACLKVFKVESKKLALYDFDEVVDSFEFCIGISYLQGV